MCLIHKGGESELEPDMGAGEQEEKTQIVDPYLQSSDRKQCQSLQTYVFCIWDGIVTIVQVF